MGDMLLKIVYTIVEKCDQLKLNIQHDPKAIEDKPVEDEKEVNAIKVIRKNSRLEAMEKLKYYFKQTEDNLKNSYTEELGS